MWERWDVSSSSSFNLSRLPRIIQEVNPLTCDLSLSFSYNFTLQRACPLPSSCTCPCPTTLARNFATFTTIIEWAFARFLKAGMKKQGIYFTMSLDLLWPESIVLELSQFILADHGRQNNRKEITLDFRHDLQE